VARAFEVGVQLHPQQTSVDRLGDAWQQAEAAGVDSVWTWDHFFPLYGDEAGGHFEGWALLGATAVLTRRPRIGVLVTSVAYRNPHLLADMARTVDHLSGGRMVLGLGAGWFERDYAEYGYEFLGPRERLDQLEQGIVTIRQRLTKLTPPPVGRVPILVGGGGERVTLRIVAQHAEWWNGFGPVEDFARKNRVLDDWCAQVGRDPDDVTRTALIRTDEVGDAEAFVEAGATHLIVGVGPPFDLAPVERLIATAEGQRAS
jgi:probable F420-dependent oxidoreductase